MRKLRFDDLTLSKTLQKAIADIGFEEATPIQSATIPLLFENKDIVGQAHTGTGKTAAFAIPIIEKIDMNLKEIQSLVLCPTRELAIQVTEEFRKLLKYKDEITAVSVYGGQDINRQLKALRKGPQILIGTPGRTIDHLKRGSINLNKVKIAVLDEADEMLDMGFKKPKIAIFYWFFSLILGLIALFLNSQQKFYAFLMVFLILAAFYVWLKLFPRQHS